MLLKIRYKKI